METDPRRRDPEDVKKLFARVSARYDAINRAMCGGLDVLWRGRLAKTAAALARENGGGGEKKYLDIACGSGDVCARLLGEDPDCRVVGADFCPEMLALAREKCGSRAEFAEADCRSLPFAENSFDAATISFGFRNFADRPACLREIARVLKTGAPLCVLEVARAEGPLFEAAQKFFMCSAVPLIARVFGGRREDYEYLAKTTMDYPRRAEVERMFANAGFGEIRTRAMAFGMVAIVSGKKRETA